jgi:hypothetical protein
MSPIGRRSVRPRPLATVRAAAVLAVALLAGGCGLVETGPPSPTPADFPGIAAELGKRGITVRHPVSGDAGCDDHVLAPTAISFDAGGLDQAGDVHVYLYVFRNRATFERLRGTIDACARAFVTDPADYESIDESPFVVAGQGPWGQKFEDALRSGLETAAGTGG